MQFLLNLLFPKFCIGCNTVGTYFCPECVLKFEYQDRHCCPYCFRPNKNGRTHDYCRASNGLDGAFSLLTYTNITKKFIKDIKYRRMYSVIEDFFHIIPNNINKTILNTITEYNIHAIQAIPLHPERKRLRGFNQSDKIARYISGITTLPVVTIISRVVNTSPQAQLKRKTDRAHNIQGAFAYQGDDSVAGKNILLVDDLFTTGSTAGEAAMVLKQHSIGRVYSFTLAHG